MYTWQLGTGEKVSEAELLPRSAVDVEKGVDPVEAVAEVWYGGSAHGSRPLVARQLVGRCSPWLSGPRYDHAGSGGGHACQSRVHRASETALWVRAPLRTTRPATVPGNRPRPALSRLPSGGVVIERGGYSFVQKRLAS
jgi:hypothetical protein